MKNIRKKLALLLAGIGCTSGLSACGQIVGPEIPEGRTEIKISLLTGGYGNEWMENLIAEANNAQDEYWFIKIGDNKHTGIDIANRVQGGIVEADIYFGDGDIDTLIRLGYCEDLTEVIESKATGETKTIKERIVSYENFEKRYSREGAIYAMPHMLSMSGIIYDHDLFVDMGWLLTDNTTASGLTKGADGVEGTYDDGLPETYAQFQSLIKEIRKNQMIPFIRGDQLGWSPYRTTSEAVWAQYEGLESYQVSYTYNGTYTSPTTGKQTQITPETGYKVYTENLLEGRAKAMQWMTETFLINDLENFYPETGLSHTDAQAIFVTSHAMQNRIAMLLDGEWWENEAKRAFEEDEYASGDEYAYGKRDFRFMPIPAMEGQVSSSNGKHFFRGGSGGTVCVLKQEDENKKEAIFDFLRMFASEKNCVNYTRCNGSLMPYAYELDDETKASLSKFSKNMMEIRNDPNTTLFRYETYEVQTPFVRGPYRWENIKYNNKTYGNPMSLYYETELTVAEYIQAVRNMYTESSWKDIA